MQNNKILSLSYHIVEICNMRCSFCFAKFNCIDRHLSMKDTFFLIEELAKAGTKKISFAGGEPTLYECLPEVITHAKRCGLTTMLITNGSGLSEHFLNNMINHLDWIGLSVDSLDKNQLKELGRQLPYELVDESYYFEKVSYIKDYGYKLKINTVVNKINFDNNMSEFINYASPKRWKLFHVLPLQNIKYDHNLLITNTEFISFYERHLNLINTEIDIISESNDAMTSSYVIIDPLGRLVDNTNYKLCYSDSILKIGVEKALEQINLDIEKMKKRKAFYDW